MENVEPTPSAVGPARGWKGWSNETRRYPLALLAGVLWALAYPTPGVAGLAWVAPGLLLLTGTNLRLAEAFRVGYLAGLIQALISLRWLLHIPHPAGAVAGWLALSGYCAVFPGCWLALASALVARRSRPEGAEVGWVPTPGWRSGMEAYAATPWARRALIPLAVAAIWVAMEMLRGRLLGGFPWNFLGVSQWRQAPLLQVARFTGVYGLSFLVCWASVAFASACVMVGLRPQNRWMWLAEARVPMFVLLVCLGTGFFRIVEERRRSALTPPRLLRVALIQPAIPQTLLWDPAERGRSFGVASRLSDSALAAGTDVLVWPEGEFGLDRDRFRAVSSRLGATAVPWVFTATDSEDAGGRELAYNAAFLGGADGRVLEIYRKRRLVAFGEYVPWVGWLPFLRHLTPIGEGFAAGVEPKRFEVGNANGKVGAAPVICFEDTFPHGIRDHAGANVDFLLELTNDGWFGQSGAQWQHLANVVFRAVENDIPIVRCTNNGITCWVDSLGVVREVLGGTGSAVYGEGFLIVQVPVGTGRTGATWYRLRGDVFGWGCVVYAGLATMGVWRRR